VERASIWLYDELRTGIECVELYERGPRRHSRGMILSAADFPAYFRALEEERAIVATDAHEDPRTREFSDCYLQPLGIGAMLDAPVRVRGRMAGVVCHEHVGGPRQWTFEEESFAASIADLATFILEAAESRRGQEALRESEERFRQLAESIRACFYITEGRTETTAGRLLYVSPAYERIWGQSTEELYQRPRAWTDSVHPDDRERLTLALRYSNIDEEFRLVRPGGEVRWIHTRAFPVPVPDGAPPRIAGIAEDVTERKRSEDELRRAKDAAEAASRAKDQFLAALSHELRTPLTPVLILASGLEADESLPDSARKALAIIRRNVELEARLIDDLLDLTRISRGKLELHPEVVDVRQILAHAVEICCEPEISSGRIRLSLELGAREHRVWADSPRLTQVFWNLFSNAVKFTPEAGEVRVRSWDDGDELAVEVCDTGIGIDPESLPRIFDAFEQTGARITRRFGGLGLGLALSRGIVEMHGGTLAAHSAGEGKGSSFIVRLPMGSLTLETAEVPADAPAPATAAPSPPEKTPGAPLDLLLVEDHADTAEAMADLLRSLGHRVTVAGSLAAARAAAEAAGGAFDLVVSDLGLPDGSGLDLMRELSGRYGLKGVALSGYGMEEDVRRSHEAGFSKHLTKPVSLQALKAVLREAGKGE
jgi:PAS domain S-box-containing protein